MVSPSSTPVPLLLVEDDPLDTLAIRRALKKARITNQLVTARDGLEAIDVLREQVCSADSGLNLLTLPSQDPVRQIEYLDESPPYLILLDLNMPRMNGSKFLAAMRSDETIPVCPVVILTGSTSDSEVVRMYDDMIVGYIQKTQVGRDFLRLISMLSEAFRIVDCPQGSRLCHIPRSTP